MPDTNPAPAAGATQTPDLAAQLATLTGVVTALAESQKGVVETIAKLAPAAQPQPAAQPAAAAADNKPLTRAELVSLLNERETQSRQASQLADQRQRYVAEKLKDLPPGYDRLLGNDPSKWAAEEQAARGQYRDFLKAQGITVPDVNGNPPASAAPGGTTTPAAASQIDLSKASPVQAIEMGLRTAKPAQAGGVAPAAGVTTTAASAGPAQPAAKALQASM